MNRDLEKIIKNYGRVAVAFSGGLDSTVLLAAARRILGDAVLAVQATACIFPRQERREAEDFCQKQGIRLLQLPFDPLAMIDFRNNSRRRCYYCKQGMWKLLGAAAQLHKAVLVDGTNADDLADDRPGMAANGEAGILSPFLQAGMGKKEIRALGEELGLPCVHKPSGACLASRVCFDDRISGDLLALIEAGEEFLKGQGLKQVRIRVAQGKIAAVEIGDDVLTVVQKENLLQDLAAFYQGRLLFSEQVHLKGYVRGYWNSRAPERQEI